MPVLKAKQAESASRSAVVLDLGDIARQGEMLKRAARAEADKVLDDARAEAERLAAAAGEEAKQQGHAQGLEQGLAEGRERGKAEALAEHRDQLNALTSAWTELAEAWEQQREAMRRDAESRVIDFAVRVAERVTHRAVEADPGRVVDQVAAALTHVLRPAEVEVRVHPDDRPALEAAVPDLVRRFDHLKHLRLADDPAVARGGCVLAQPGGEVDATLDTQLARIASAVIPSADKSDESAATPAAPPADADGGTPGAGSTPDAGS